MFYNLHISLIASAIGLVLLNDFIGLSWVLGLKRQYSERFLRIEHRLISLAFLGAVGTGVAMSISKPEVIRNNGYWIKMAFVAAIGLNGYFTGKMCGALAQRRFRDLPPRTKVSVHVSVMFSLILWLATTLAGVFVMHSDFKML